ncbi:hypothetical protein MT1_3156 [Pseudomonas sp. MT-1]|uniref:toprim domain-containing protein n=1 Tax=Stutzerimonas stutzeri TaxID=316 RepID=UPI000536432B|nr:toprim domain-containing protein [Stutzerimonas stutzeri]MCQ4282894.1 toprim domain-containing protein [Stutzerimonas stutzeri]BAP80331.1 hypothetical protein MT1_3156 [Pseudomonas sp. MT-1]|tara:strand:+ start:2735 stop:3616 length:882 start_codon:yes stop_codon:yes gene_type:complete
MIEVAFREALQAAWGQIDCLPAADGKIHRLHVPGDRPGTQNGWYVLHLDGIPSGAFGSWKAGDYHTWNSRKPTDLAEAELIRKRVEQARHQREAKQHQRQQAVALEAQRCWRTAAPAGNDHPYLRRKGCQVHGLRQQGDVLLVPLYLDRVLANLQRIHPDGSKRFLAGGRIKNAHSPIGTLKPGRPLYLCEGWATGATIHEHNGAAVACAMNAGNLLAVGQQLRRTYPDSPLVVAGDDDRLTKGNPGRTSANHAAALLGCGVVMPPWSGTEPLNLSDFNDLRQWQRQTNESDA